jgi:hypothetical protein
MCSIIDLEQRGGAERRGEKVRWVREGRENQYLIISNINN